MPKIKVKNIPAIARERVCNKMSLCSKCPCYSEEGFMTDKSTHTVCMFSGYDSKEMVVELSEKDFPTNREWLASLPNDKLANNLVTNPILLKVADLLKSGFLNLANL